MILRFGKFKGQEFGNTPQWYQDWLLQQEWFKMESDNIDLSKYSVEYCFQQGTDQDLESFKITEIATGKSGNYIFDAGDNITRQKVISIFIDDLKNNKIR